MGLKPGFIESAILGATGIVEGCLISKCKIIVTGDEGQTRFKDCYFEGDCTFDPPYRVLVDRGIAVGCCNENDVGYGLSGPQ